MSGRRHQLIPCLDRFTSAIVGCAGDIMLDRFVYGDVHRISPEAPIPVLGIQSQQSMLGGVGNVVRNLEALGCGIRLFAVTGDDGAGAEVNALVEKVRRCESYLLAEPDRRTAVKIRYIAHGQQLLRADNETSEQTASEVFGSLLSHFTAHVAECSIVFLSDYAKGMLKGSHASEFIRVAKAAGKPVVVDPKGRDFERYRGVTVIKPNLKELAEATGMPVGDTASQEAAARKLLEVTEARFLLLTRGPAGMLLVPQEGPPAEFPALAREVYDVSGAGDTVAAVLAGALGSGAGMEDAVELANIAAGIAVGKVGTATVDRSEIIREIQHESSTAINPAEKILMLEQVDSWVEAERAAGHRIGFTCGAFDLMHAGHAQYLTEARALCDRLLVAVNSDASIQSYKNPLRPVNAWKERAFLVAALASTDCVTVLQDDRPLNLIQRWKPDLYIKGGDYQTSSLRSASAVESYGGKVVVIPAQFAASTSAMLERIEALSIHAAPQHPGAPRPKGLVLLDRDGTLIRNTPFDPSTVELLPGVVQALRDLQSAGFRLCLVTNQQGIGLGYFGYRDFIEGNRKLLGLLGKAGIAISKIYFCPHSLADSCECRKPAPGLILRALREQNIAHDRCFVVGDSVSDIEAAQAAGCVGLLVDQDHGIGEAAHRILDS
jgi:D-beta-D-heptose 7-phosphate kinase / D-beta-D-heptose 1-phosphate adenosyltransferase